MSKIILATLTFLMTASAFAEFGPPQRPGQLSREALQIANLMINPDVVGCVQSIEKKHHASFEIDAITKTSREVQTVYVLEGTMVLGGDAVTGHEVLKIVKTLRNQFEGGPTISCEIVSGLGQ